MDEYDPEAGSAHSATRRPHQRAPRSEEGGRPRPRPPDPHELAGDLKSQTERGEGLCAHPPQARILVIASVACSGADSEAAQGAEPFAGQPSRGGRGGREGRCRGGRGVAEGGSGRGGRIGGVAEGAEEAGRGKPCAAVTK